MDKRWEEQLERMRRLNEQLTAINRRVEENNRLIARDRAISRGPLNDIRDFRTHQSPDYEDFPPSRHVRPSLAEADDAPRRRRRRR